MKDDLIWELLSLKLSGEATPEDIRTLDNLLLAHPEYHFKVELLTTLWLERHMSVSTKSAEDSFSSHLQRLSNHLADPALQYEHAPIVTKTPRLGKMKYLLMGVGVAAAVAFAIVIDVFRTETSSPGAAQNVVSTKPGSKTKISLPDGTQVWLNADSKITYEKEFGKNLREVELTGEAFFDVVKDKEHPFVIHTKSINVKVLGTAFNVRSYPDEKTAETSLIRGIVEVSLKNNPERKIILKPNEKLVVKIDSTPDTAPKGRQSAETSPMLVLTNLHYFRGDSTAVETSWIKNKLVFDGESLENVGVKLERWYGVKISIRSDKLKKELYTSVFEDESLPEVMHALQLTGNFKYSIDRKEITITP